MPAAVATPTDADLVQSCLTEGAGAFAEIVARYQALVCSLTYNATGSLSRSEDLAQEVFLTAWKELRQLREPAKLRAWLCGIARRLTAKTLHRETREPVCAAGELTDEHHAPTPDPAAQTISREEEAILWRTLEQIPETYREPLILFYREGQSVENVATALDLTEDATKQRLSRGRKMLQEQVAAFIEGALRQSTPGRAFTLGVIAALPLAVAASTGTATAATIGGAAAKTGAAVTGASLLTILGILLGPIAGLLGAWFGVRASLDAAETEGQRRLIRHQSVRMIVLAFGFMVVMGFVLPFAGKIWHTHTSLAIALGAILPVLYLALLFLFIFRCRRAQDRLFAQETTLRNPEAAAPQNTAWKTFEYKSPATFLGLPLIHIRSGRPRGAKLVPAIGWIALGDVAIGLISIGAFSIGGISLGGFSLGLFATGGATAGLIAIGGLAIGLLAATGGIAFGYVASGGCAFALHGALGGMAVARDFALGDSVTALHANDTAARLALTHDPTFHWGTVFARQQGLMAIVWLPMLLLLWQTQRARRALKQARQSKIPS